MELEQISTLPVVVIVVKAMSTTYVTTAIYVMVKKSPSISVNKELKQIYILAIVVNVVGIMQTTSAAMTTPSATTT